MISVVMPTRNKAGHLRLTLAGFRRQRSAPRFEVVVADDGSTDDSQAVIDAAREQGVPVRVVRREGSGRAAARNAGAEAATGDLLVFVDDDILVPPGFLAAHAAAHQPGDAVVHGPLRELPRAQRLLATMPTDPYGTANGGDSGRTFSNALERMVLAMADGSVPPVAPWLACVGANVSMRRALWARTGGFDESFGTVWGCEDLEFGYRLHALGVAMRIAPDANGIHLTHARPDRWTEHAVNMRRFVAGHPDPTVVALPELLAASGSPERYLWAVSNHQHIGTFGEEAR